MSESCARMGCTSIAVFFPVVFVPGATNGLGPPAELALDLPVCASCATKTRVEDVMDDQGFALFCESLRKRGLATPDRAAARLAFVPLSQSPFHGEGLP